MASGTIIFSDIVGFSKLSTSIQKALVNSLTNEVMYEIREYLSENLTLIPHAIALPTGDGVALVLVHNEPDVWTTQILEQLLIRLVNWQSKNAKLKNRNEIVRLRIGMHHGSIDFFTDINGKTNVCGNTINMAQRVMDAANDSQILLSDDAVKKHFGLKYSSDILQDGKSYKAYIAEPISVTVKHGMRLQVYPMKIDNIEEYDNTNPNSSKYLVLTTTKLPKEIDGEYSSRIASASELAFIQLTGERLLSKIETREMNFSSDLRSLKILMPSSTSSLFLSIEQGEEKRNKQKVFTDRWIRALQNIKKEIPSASIEIIQFTEPPYYGATYVDWKKPGGFIHISPYIWGVQTTECPGYDMLWNSNDEPVIFQRYIKGLDYLIGISKIKLTIAST